MGMFLEMQEFRQTGEELFITLVVQGKMMQTLLMPLNLITK